MSSFGVLIHQGLLFEAEDGSFRRLGTSYTGKTEVSNIGPWRWILEKLDETKALIRNLRNKLSALCDENANQVFQVNLQFFPLVEAMESTTVTNQESKITQQICNPS